MASASDGFRTRATGTCHSTRRSIHSATQQGYMLLMSWVTNFSQFLSTTNCFFSFSYRLVDTSAPNDPQMSLEPYKVKYTSYMCYWCHWVRFALRSAVLDLQAILRQVHRMTPKWPWTLQPKIYPTYYTSVPDSQISLRFALRPAVLELYKSFWKKCTWMKQVQVNDPKLPWTLLGQMHPIYMLLD